MVSCKKNVQSACPKVYLTVMKSETMSHIFYEKLREKASTLMHLESNVSRDGMKEEKVVKRVLHIIC